MTDTMTDTLIGKYLRAYRHSNKKTVTEIATKINKSKASITVYETKQCDFNTQKIALLAHGYSSDAREEQYLQKVLLALKHFVTGWELLRYSPQPDLYKISLLNSLEHLTNQDVLRYVKYTMELPN